MLLPPPRSTLFPYTTLFRSLLDRRIDPDWEGDGPDEQERRERQQNRQDEPFPDQAGDGLPPLEGLAEVAVQQRSEEHTSELQSRFDLVCRLLLEKKKKKINGMLGEGPDGSPFFTPATFGDGAQAIPFTRGAPLGPACGAACRVPAERARDVFCLR